MAAEYSTCVHNACAIVDDNGIVQARQLYSRASTRYLSHAREKTVTDSSEAYIKISQPSTAAAWHSKLRPNEPPENSTTTRVSSPSRGSRKVRRAFKAMCRMLSPNRATQEYPCSTDTGRGRTDDPAYVGQSDQHQARHSGQQRTDLPPSPRTYPVRSAMRGARPKKAADASRRVQFSEEARQPSQSKHEIPTSPRTFPLRSAIRGSRPKQGTDSSRRVHFAGGAPGRLRS